MCRRVVFNTSVSIYLYRFVIIGFQDTIFNDGGPGVSAVAVMIYMLVRDIRHREKIWKIFIKEAEIVAWIMVWLYMGWE